MSVRPGVVWLTTQIERERTDGGHIFARQRMVERASRLLREVHSGLFRFSAGLFVLAARRETASGALHVGSSRQLVPPRPSSRWSAIS